MDSVTQQFLEKLRSWSDNVDELAIFLRDVSKQLDWQSIRIHTLDRDVKAYQQETKELQDKIQSLRIESERKSAELDLLKTKLEPKTTWWSRKN